MNARGCGPEDDAPYLVPARVMLCDLLWGRWIRAFAERELADALTVEALGAPRAAVTEALDRAAHYEWMAARSEQGQVLWGERLDRQGRRPEDADR